jgi:DNA-binding SARP family transcriptional activator/TolB-like protein
MEMARLSTDRVLLLGPLQVIHNGTPLSQPPSRKVRSLLAYLAMAPRPVTRERLCELLWDAVDDPRSELRWCLCKLRLLVDGPTTTRLIANRHEIWIDANSLYVDALFVARNAQKMLTTGSPNDLRSVLALFRGDFIEGLSTDRAPAFENWLASQRHRLGQLRQQLLERLSALLSPADRIEVLREIIEIAPFDETAHVALVRALLGCALYAEANHQIVASVKRFESEGVDPTTLRSGFATTQRVILRPTTATCIDVAHSDPRCNQQVSHTRRPTLLVMPFSGATPEGVSDADSITSDIIFAFARLRSIGVIARGTAFSLRSQRPAAAAALVNARYVASGHLRREGKKCLVSIELVDPESDCIFWADELSCSAADCFCMPPLLIARIVTVLDAAIYSVERNRTQLTQPASLDAWQAYHRGLVHMYRPAGSGSREAQQFFFRAIALDPTFSRNYAGLSFTHFYNAFLQQTHDRNREVALAFETAGQALETDLGDPAAHWAMGRALWLRREHEGAIGALDQSIRLSPSYALAHYGVAFVHCQTGDPARALEAADIAAHLSPLDPMLFAIHGSRTFALLRLGRTEEAAEFAVRGGQQPNAHLPH